MNTTNTTTAAPAPAAPPLPADDPLTLAIARIYLDNFPSLQSSWVTMGPKIGQM